MSAAAVNRQQKIAEARRLRSEGLTSPEIGERLGVPASTARGWCLGGECPCGALLNGSKGEKSKVCAACNHARNAERNRRLAELLEADTPTREIARQLGMAETAVRTWVNIARRRYGRSLTMRRLQTSKRVERLSLIARRIREGRTDREIAAELGTSPVSMSVMASQARREGFDMPRRSEVAGA